MTIFLTNEALAGAAEQGSGNGFCAGVEEEVKEEVRGPHLMLKVIVLTVTLLWPTLAPATLIAGGWAYDLTMPALAERVTALEKEVALRAKIADDSRELAKFSMEKRLDSMNEFREALKDQASKMLTRLEYDDHHRRVTDDIKILMKSRAELEGKASQQALLLVLAVALSGMVFGIIGLIMRFLKV